MPESKPQLELPGDILKDVDAFNRAIDEVARLAVKREMAPHQACFCLRAAMAQSAEAYRREVLAEANEVQKDYPEEPPKLNGGHPKGELPG